MARGNFGRRPTSAPRDRRRPNINLGSFDKAAIDEVWDAIQALRAKLPQLQKFARMATGRPDLVVEITTDTPHTKGNRVYIRPPLGLGKKYEHDRSKCGQRGRNRKQMCQACQVREVIDFYLYHELAHVIGGTQVQVRHHEHTRARREATRLHPQGCVHHREVFERLDYLKVNGCDAMTLGKAFNPFLSMLINVLEDARINEMTFGARPGMRTAFDVNIEQLLTEGTEIGNGKTSSWAEAPLDMQFIVGLQIAASGADYVGAFHADVIKALQDKKLIELCQRAIHLDSVYDIFTLSLEIQRHAETLGYCVVAPCEPPPPSPDIPSDPEENGQGEGPGGSGEGAPAGDEMDRESDGSDDSDSASAEDTSTASPAAGSSDDSDEVPADESGDTGSPDEDGADGDGGQSDGPGNTGGGDDGEGTGGGGSEDADPEPEESGEVDGEAEVTSSECGDGSPLSGDGEPDDASNQAQASGISGPGKEGSSVQGSGEPEDAMGASWQAGVGNRNEVIPSEPQPGSGELETAGDDRGEQDSDTSGDGDAEVGTEISEVEEAEADSDYTDPTNPWGIENPERPDVDEPAFEAPSTPVEPSPTELGDHGTPDDAARGLARFLMHGIDDELEHLEGLLDEMADGDVEAMVGIPEGDRNFDFNVEALIKIAMQQVHVFDGPSANVATTEVAVFPHEGLGWDVHTAMDRNKCMQSELPTLFAPPEGLIGNVLLHARTVFDSNKRSHIDKNRTSGKIRTKVLATRAPVGDPRLFGKKTMPKKKSYFVVLGGDASGSTRQVARNPKIKRALHAQGDLLHRLGIPWAGYMHSAYQSSLFDWNAWGYGDGSMLWNYLLPFKTERDGWNDEAKTRLACIVPIAQNLDGHTLQAYRKIAMQSSATDKIVIYYTDGEMPAANAAEERILLDEEIALYKRHGIALVCVAIQTDSPKRLGLPTVRVDSDEDIVKVLQFLDKILTK